MTDDTRHPIIAYETRRIRVLLGGHSIADSTDVLVVREPGQPPVRYFPREDVEMAILARSAQRTASQTKGEATYFSVFRDAHVIENAIWSFEAPPEPFGPIATRIAFQPIHFEFEAAGESAADWELNGESGLPRLPVAE